MLVLRSIYLYFGSYTCITEHILVLQILYLCYRAYSCILDLIRSLFWYKSTRRYYTDSLYGGTHRYHWTYTYFTDTKLHVGTTEIHYMEVPIGTTGLILILQNLYLFYRYGSTRRYYRDFTCTKVPVGTTEHIQGTRRYIQNFTRFISLLLFFIQSLII